MRAFYFAYGANLDENSMKDTYTSAEIYKFAILRGFRLTFAGKEEGVCSIYPSSNSDYVEGLLYTLNESELDEPTEPSYRTQMEVICDNGEIVRAYVYFINQEDFVAPSEEYLLRVHKKYGDYGFEMKNLETALEDLISKKNESCF